MKTILSFLVFLNLFNLSLEAIELPLFESASFSVTEKKEAQIYLNTSIYIIYLLNFGQKNHMIIFIAI